MDFTNFLVCFWIIGQTGLLFSLFVTRLGNYELTINEMAVSNSHSIIPSGCFEELVLGGLTWLIVSDCGRGRSSNACTDFSALLGAFGEKSG